MSAAPQYLRPARLADALGALSATRAGDRAPLAVLAGGTDHYPAHVGRPLSADVLDITAIPALQGITATADHWRIGAATTWSALIGQQLPPLFDGLKLAAREIGGMQIQNRGTLAGNICNASPAADGAPVLLAMDASVELHSTQGMRTIPLAQFITGPRRTVRRSDELVTALLIPKPDPGVNVCSHFAKLGARRYLVISIAMVGVVLEATEGKVVSARIAVGACSPVALRLHALEQALRGLPADASLSERVEAQHLAGLSPIDDVRADRGYRLDVARTLVQRTLRDACASMQTSATRA